ncbi:TIR domain-containing protein [Sorangium sp. So ce128]|uniref:TIR domain-containing protein n=1 Tax=Sorangium sp. So ce128 TaxID=3133281 RepID=UPI003F60877B
MAELHRRLLETTARWPQAEGENDFRRRYAARHAIAHAFAADDKGKARGLCRDLGLLGARCSEDGAAALEETLRFGAKELGDGDIDLLHRAVRAESHWLRDAPEALPELVYNRLRSAGWEAERIARTLQFPRGLPKIRLRYPVRMWTGEERTLHGHSESVNACAISPDGQRIVSASDDSTLRVWDLATGQLLSTLEGHSESVKACAISPDGQRIVSASWDKTLKLWDLATGQLLSSLEDHSSGVEACAISPDGQRIVSASSDSTLKVWDLATGQLLCTLEGHSDPVAACAISPDGQRIVSASWDTALKVWDLATGQLLSPLEDHSDSVDACAISPDGRRIVSASNDKTLKVWDLATGQLLSTLESHSNWVNACAISPDGQRIVSTSSDSTLKVWDLATGQLLSTLEGHSGPVAACAISPDGQRIVSTSYDSTLKVWDLATGQLLCTLEGHSDSVNACAISSDGQRIVSASSDMTIKRWETSTGKCLDTVHGIGTFISVAGSQQLLCAGDAHGNLWHLYFTAPIPRGESFPIKNATRLFFSYSHQDEALRDELEAHLALLKHDGLLQSWHDRRIAAGEAWAGQIDKNLDTAEVILLLISADFLASDYCFDKEMRRALERHDAGRARVIPVILRETDWRGAPFARLQALPRDGRPVTSWRNRDAAWTDVALGIRRAVEALRGHVE